MQAILFRRERTVARQHKRFYGSSVRITAAAVLKTIEYSPESPHPLMEMGVEVTVENRVAYHPVKAAGAV